MKPPLKIAKISPPKLSKVYHRKRLFKVLDEARERAIIWVSAPAGSGKTTLITSYLNARRLPCLWYQVDSGDGDIASFFYYLGLAAKKLSPRRKPLPLLTPEYLGGIDVFTRNFFRELYNRLNPSVSPLTKGGIKRGVSKGGFAIVLDNYQDAPVESPLHNIIQHGLSEIPDGINVIIISRSEPPSQLVRLQASGSIALLEWDTLRLTMEESAGISKLRAGNKKLTQQCVQALHERTQGWIAGLVLMLEYGNIEGIRNHRINESTQQPIFDYFASEIFQRAKEETQHFLLKTSFLPKITIPMAQGLTDNRHAQQILTGLIHRNYFTIRLTGASETYEYHPLFREFLLSQARKSYPSSKLEYIQSKAAILLEEDGQIAGAITLLCVIGDWQGASRIILRHAQTLLQEGRSQTLEGWLRSLPQQMLEETSWLLYWLGACRMAFNPTDARGYFEKAFTLFQQQQDRSGMFLAWAHAVSSFFHDVGPAHRLDPWIALLEELLQQDPGFPSLEIEAHVASNMFFALMFHQPEHPWLAAWAERARTLVEQHPDINLRMQTGFYLSVHHMWLGEFAKAAAAVQRLREWVTSADASPLIRITAKTTEAMYDMLTAAFDSSLKAIAEGLAIARESGVEIWDYHLLAHGVAAALGAGDQAKADELLATITANLDLARAYDQAYYHFLLCWQALLRRDLVTASQQEKISWKYGEWLGWPFGDAVIRTMTAQVLHEHDLDDEAGTRLAEAAAIARKTNSRLIDYAARVIEAQIAFDRGDDVKGLASLGAAFALGKEYGIVNFFGWRSDVMARLCMKALEAGIEVEYVQSLIRKRNLIPDVPPLHLDNWPWQIRVYTLGRFNVIKGQKPLTFTASSHKPLELLSALIAFGGRGISKEMLIEALWPDAEGDVAQQNFETTLHRLRKLLSSDEMLVLKDGRLTLDDRYCWVDCWAFERLLTQLEHLLGTADAKPNEVDKTAKKIFNLYHGHFLGRESDHSWSLTLRERLRSRFLRHIKDMGRYWKGHKKTDEAVKYYIKGLEIDPISEGLYYGLMQCYIELGDFAEAISVYKRCCHTLKTLLNTTPSPKIEVLYHSIKHDKTPQQEDRTSQ